MLDFDKAAHDYNKGVITRAFRPKEVLRRIGTVRIPASTESFVAKEILKTYFDSQYPKSIDNFFRRFDIVEDIQNESVLYQYELLFNMTDHFQLLVALGGIEKVLTTLTQINFLLSNQRNGETGYLSLWERNVFYVKDYEGEVMRVTLKWFSNSSAWSIHHDTLTDTAWNSSYVVFRGSMVFSPSESQPWSPNVVDISNRLV